MIWSVFKIILKLWDFIWPNLEKKSNHKLFYYCFLLTSFVVSVKAIARILLESLTSPSSPIASPSLPQCPIPIPIHKLPFPLLPSPLLYLPHIQLECLAVLVTDRVVNFPEISTRRKFPEIFPLIVNITDMLGTAGNLWEHAWVRMIIKYTVYSLQVL